MTPNDRYLRIDRAGLIERAIGKRYDLIVIGGGVQGTFTARDAALRGLRVLLLERNDFAYGASSRSSKLLHGGVRYLEQGNIKLVREALQERSILLKTAPHLSRIQPFLFPIIEGRSRSFFEIRFGLSLYDLLSSAFRSQYSVRFPSSRRSSKSEIEELQRLGLSTKAAVLYADAQMDDGRLVIEGMLDAVSAGADCLNWSAPKSLQRKESGWEISWQCAVTGRESSAEGGLVINAGGPWAPEIHTLTGAEWPGPPPVYSTGIHLIFDREWSGAALILPTGERGRYYFVLPHFAPGVKQTLVGTTDRKISQNIDAPLPTEEERVELLKFLQRDLPQAGLTADRVTGEFSGVRILGGAGATTSKLSRSEALLEQDRYLCLFGGKWTTARAIAERAVDRAVRILGVSARPCQTRTRMFPDSASRFNELRGDDYIRARITASINSELAVTVDDIVLRRLRMAFHPDRSRVEEMVKALLDEAGR